MIKHIVMWNMAGDTKEDRRKAAEFLRSRFEELRGEVLGCFISKWVWTTAVSITLATSCFIPSSKARRLSTPTRPIPRICGSRASWGRCASHGSRSIIAL